MTDTSGSGQTDFQDIQALRQRIAQLEQDLRVYQASHSKAVSLQRALLKISQVANTAGDLNTFYRLAHQVLNEIIPAENFYIALHNPAANQVEFPYFVDQFHPNPGTRRFGNGLTEMVIRTRQPQRLTLAQIQALVEAGSLTRGLIRDSLEWMGVPLQTADNRITGVLAVQTYSAEEHYSQEDQEMLAVVAHQVAMAMERQLRDTDLRRMNELLETRVAERTAQLEAEQKLQSALFQITEAASYSQNLPQLFNNVHQIIANLIPAQSFYVALYDIDTDMLTFPYFVDMDEPTPAPRKFGKGKSEYPLIVGKPVLLTAEGLNALMAAGEIESSGKTPCYWIGAPLSTAENSMIGTLVIQSYDPNQAYTEQDKDLIGFVSTQVAMVIERKRAEAAVRASEERHRLLTENASDLISTHLLDSRFTYVSPSVTNLLGFSENYLLGKPFYAFIYPEDLDAVRAAFESVPGRDDAVIFSYRAPNSAGALQWFETTAKGYRNPHSVQVESIIAISRNITERKRNEKLQQVLFQISEAANSAQSLDALYGLVHTAISELIPAKNFFIALHDPENDFVSYPYFVDEFDEPPAPRKMKNGLTEYILRTGEPLLVSPDVFTRLGLEGKVESIGSPSIDWLGVPLKNTEGKTFGVLTVQSYTEVRRYTQEDLSLLEFVSRQVAMAIERRRAQEALLLSESNYRSLFESVPIGLYRSDVAGDLLEVNTTCARLLGFSDPSAMVAEGLDNLYLSTEDLNRWWSTLEKEGTVQNYEMQMRRRDGKVIWVSRTARAVRNPQNRVLYYHGSMVDITERKRVEEEVQQANASLLATVSTLERRNTESSLISEMGDMLQSCQAVDEAYAVVADYATRLFAGHPGALYINRKDDNSMEAVAVWGNPSSSRIFNKDDCWGLRRGRLHFIMDPHSRLRCAHLGADIVNLPYTCVPMTAQGEMIGMLFLQDAPGQPFAEIQPLAVTVGERLSLSLANLKLRETLHHQSVRDPLTGLFNRRYMEETLERELSRASRYVRKIGVIMMDIDHLKGFNDVYGHDAGDMLLRELGAYLLMNVRGEDVACRFGGEEFILIMPGASLEDTLLRAEQMRSVVEGFRVQYRGQSLGKITISLGVAAYPEHGVTDVALVKSADQALLRAKEQGRNRVVSARDLLTNPSG